MTFYKFFRPIVAFAAPNRGKSTLTGKRDSFVKPSRLFDSELLSKLPVRAFISVPPLPPGSHRSRTNFPFVLFHLFKSFSPFLHVCGRRHRESGARSRFLLLLFFFFFRGMQF